MEELFYLEGSISVKAALECHSRPVSALIIEEKKSGRDLNYLLRLAEQEKIPVHRLPREKIDLLAEGTSHGGILAAVGARYTVELAQLLTAPSPFLVLLEGIEDPYNFGGALRSLYAAGVTGIILPKRNWFSAAGIVAKASAGASERMPVTTAGNFSETLSTVRKNGIPVICALRKESATDLYATPLPRPLLLAVGGEMRGLSEKVAQQADRNVYIPYGNEFRNAMSASAACAIIAFEIFRQNRT